MQIYYTLREVNMNPMIIDQNSLHFEICLFTVLLVFEFDKSVLKAIASSLITNDLTRQDFPEAAENQI